MRVYVLILKNRDRGTFVPSYEIHMHSPDASGRVLILEPGECVDVAKFKILDDPTCVEVKEYRVSNIDGKPTKKLTDTYILERYIQ